MIGLFAASGARMGRAMPVLNPMHGPTVRGDQHLAHQRDSNDTNRKADSARKGDRSQPRRRSRKSGYRMRDELRDMFDCVGRICETMLLKAMDKNVSANPQHCRRSYGREKPEENRHANYKPATERADQPAKAAG